MLFVCSWQNMLTNNLNLYTMLLIPFYKLALFIQNRLDKVKNERLYYVLRRFRNVLFKLDDNQYFLSKYGFKQWILHLIWNFLIAIDKGESYSYETAPYCGHHYSGFENKYIKTSYHEGYGGGTTKIMLFRYYIDFDSDSKDKKYTLKKFKQFTVKKYNK